MNNPGKPAFRTWPLGAYALPATARAVSQAVEEEEVLYLVYSSIASSIVAQGFEFVVSTLGEGVHSCRSPLESTTGLRSKGDWATLSSASVVMRPESPPSPPSATHPLSVGDRVESERTLASPPAPPAPGIRLAFPLTVAASMMMDPPSPPSPPSAVLVPRAEPPEPPSPAMRYAAGSSTTRSARRMTEPPLIPSLPRASSSEEPSPASPSAATRTAPGSITIVEPSMTRS